MDPSSTTMTEQCDTLRDQLAAKLGIGAGSIDVKWSQLTWCGTARVIITLPLSDARELAK